MKLSAEHRTDIFIPSNELAAFGWSYLSPAANTKPRNLDRMEAFNARTGETSDQRFDRYTNIAYYALELSADLPPLETAIADFSAAQRSSSDDPEYDAIVDRFIVATGVSQQLWEAAHQSAELSFDDVNSLREATVYYTPANTGCLKTVRNMAVENKKLGWISETTAKNTEVILRMVIAKEMFPRMDDESRHKLDRLRPGYFSNI